MHPASHLFRSELPRPSAAPVAGPFVRLRRALVAAALGLASCSPVDEPAGTAVSGLRGAPQMATSDWTLTTEAGIAAGEYAPRADGDTFHVTNRAQDLRATFATGVTVQGRDGAGEVGISLRAWGREDAVIAADATLPEEGRCLADGAVDAFGECLHRVDYARPGLREWWENRPEGLEQGFTVTAPPDGEGALVFDLALTGALVDVEDDAAQLVRESGDPLRFGSLSAHDERGRELPVWMEETDDGLRILVDDSGAVGVVTVDPLLTTAAWTAEADQASAQFGISVASAGDVNADGYGDVVIGAYKYDNGETDEGRAYLYLGSSSGLSTTAAWTTEGDQASAQLGYSVAGAGDVNGDGYSDVVVGAYAYDNGSTDEGRAAVYLGSATGLGTTAAWTGESNQASAYYGISVASAGDVNGDGYGDLVVGAYRYDTRVLDEGKVFVYLGSATGLATTAATAPESDQDSAWFGHSVASAGDVNGDGYGDVVVGAVLYDNGSSNEGGAFVYLGSAAGLVNVVAWSGESNQAGAWYGHSVASAGDVNGDGYGDVMVGSPTYDNGSTDEGRAFVYLGSASGLATSAAWTAEPDQATDYFAAQLGSAGDVNGDGYADVVVGSSVYDNGSTDEGRAWVYLGSSSGLATSAAWTAESDQAYGYLGASVASAGDVNGDGFGDLLVGAPLYDNGSTDEGRATVYLGSGSGLATSAGWSGEGNQASASYGYSVASAGDVNGDGYGDVVVGAHRYDNGSTDEGRAYLFLGSSTGLATTAAWTAESDQASAYFGVTVASAGDVNGDGYGDVVIGAVYYDNGQTDEGRAYLYLGSATGLTTSAAWTEESNQASAYLGYAVASAGDVNGDGYGDVVVGAYLYTNGQSGEGRAYLFHGSASGLATSAAWTAEADQANAQFARSVASAGDVNGDGYGDLVVGARYYTNGSSSEGRATVYLGSATGLPGTAAWTTESNSANAYFGSAVGSAGDVNGDGYGDLIVGAPGYTHGSSEEGGAFVYLGSSSGLGTSAVWTDEANQASAWFGAAAASAGDVNGDGYGDVVVGAYLYSNGSTSEGRANVYLGSSAGLATSAGWTAEPNQAGAYLGGAVASAGDVNGDGFSDLLVGASGYDNGSTDEGAAFLYMGNGADGTTPLAHAPQARQTGSTTPIVAGLASTASDTFDVAVTRARTPWGLGKVKVQVEAKPLGTAFDGTDLQTQTSYTSSGLTGASVQQVVSGLTGSTGYHWRARVLASPAEGRPLGWGPWMYGGLSGDAVGAHVFTAGATFYADADGDGYGDSATSTVSRSSSVSGYVTDATDCDDTDAAVSPAATETCDDLDDDCDGGVDEGDTAGSVAIQSGGDWEVASSQADLDAGNTTLSSSPGPGACWAYTEANLGRAFESWEHSGTQLMWEATGLRTAYFEKTVTVPLGATITGATITTVADDDHLLYVNGVLALSDLDAVAGPILSTDISAYVSAGENTIEIVGYDYSGGCYWLLVDGTIDYVDAPSDASTWYADADGDGDGDAATVATACDAPADYVAASTDCDDTTASVYLGAAEIVADGIDQDCDTVDSCFTDADGDNFGTTVVTAGSSLDCATGSGAAVSTDCDDTSASVYLGATEIVADGIDQDCDAVDACYTDADGDNYGTAVVTDGSSLSCASGTGAMVSTDCDDTSATVYLGATEIVADGIDQDCDTVDSCFTDADGDNFGTTVVTAGSLLDCATGSGAAVSTDCDDTSASVYLGATEIVADGIDQDCDAVDSCYTDADGDDYGTTVVIDGSSLSCASGTGAAVSTDCDDTSASVYLGATEIVADGIDQDCDAVDSCYTDADGDNQGTTVVTDGSSLSCASGTGAAVSTDCDDTSASVYLGATEIVADGIDQDCDAVDSCYTDADGDDYGTTVVIDGSSLDCATGPGAPVATDCDDTVSAINPAATETCNGADDDCDGLTDDASATGRSTWYADVDGDGYGSTSAVSACDAPAGYVSNANDCDDADVAINPAATETCNGADDDCDGLTDDASATGQSTWYADADGDGYGSTTAVTACDLPVGYVANADDCDDTDLAVNPGAVETVGDAVDGDCDGAERCYTDADDDGYRPDATSSVSSSDADCSDPGEALASAPTTDCDDTDAAINPAASEIAGDAVDQDCDDAESCYVDADRDGARTAFQVASPDVACTAPGEALATAELDCDDADATAYPAANEIPGSGVDEDCDGSETCFADADADGYRPDATATVVSVDSDCDDLGEALSSALTGDCDDASAAYNPAATESDCADPNDYNCDGSVGYADTDGDGYAACEECDDGDASVFPGAVEEAGDGVDGDCDGVDLCYVDDDGDGYRADESTIDGTTVACDGAGEAGATAALGDCDDGDPGIHPAAVEGVGDAVDADCDGAESCFADGDADGYRADDGSVVVSADTDCADTGEALASAGVDCDDTRGDVSPAASEQAGDEIDQDCDTTELCYVDLDGDGFRPDATSTVTSADVSCADPGEAPDSAATTDCDDTDATAFPGAVEITGDAIDSDCDGAELCYLDADDDGYVDGSQATVASSDPDCDDAQEALATALTGDCDDASAAYNPGAAEIDCADPNDYNCDGSVGYADADGDGFGACEECDDADAGVYPGAVELAGDTIDSDCDGAEVCFVDADDDGYRPDTTSTVSSTNVACDGAGEAVATDATDDCDDTDAAVNPGATETVGDELDEDCDGAELCYVDADGDGYTADGGATVVSADSACDASGEATASAVAGDCDDADAAFYPGAAETDCADPADYNCDGSSGFADADGDGFPACEECDDALGEVNPDAEEVCNGLDDDCDGTIDQDVLDATTWYADSDADGYTDPTVSVTACEPPDGYAAATSVDDCDDGDPASFPGADEVPEDGIDQDCDGLDASEGSDDTGHDSGEYLPEDDTGEGAVAKDPGCGCSSGGVPAVWALLAGALTVGTRRSRTRRGTASRMAALWRRRGGFPS